MGLCKIRHKAGQAFGAGVKFCAFVSVGGCACIRVSLLWANKRVCVCVCVGGWVFECECVGVHRREKQKERERESCWICEIDSCHIDHSVVSVDKILPETKQSNLWKYSSINFNPTHVKVFLPSRAFSELKLGSALSVGFPVSSWTKKKVVNLFFAKLPRFRWKCQLLRQRHNFNRC